MTGRTDQSVFAKFRYKRAGGHHAPRRWSLARVVAAAGMVGSVLFTMGAVTAIPAGADSGSTLTGSPFNGSDGVLDTTPAGAISFHSDAFNSSSDNIFGAAPAAKEDQVCPTITTGNANNKIDLKGFYIGEANGSPTSTAANDHFLYLAWSRVATTGDANIDFELNQSTSSPTCTSPTVNKLRTAGDILLQYNFQSTGGAITLSAYRWITNKSDGTCDVGNGSPPCWHLDSLMGSSSEASVSSDTTFGEMVVNLNASGIFQSGVCENLGSGFAKSRESHDSDAALADYVAPAGIDVVNCAPTTTTTTPSSTNFDLGGSLTDGVTVAGNATGGAPVGNVTFYVCPNTTTGCDPTSSGAQQLPATTNPVAPNPVDLTQGAADKSTATSPSYTPPSPGNYCFAGVYAPPLTGTGSGVYFGSSDTSADECFTVNPIKPGFTTNPTSTSITFGGSNTDSATVAGNSAGGVPGGSVSFSLCKESTVGTPCTGGTSVATAAPTAGTPSGDSRTFNSASATPTSTGTWCFNASYTAGSGSNYTDVSAETNAAAECFTVNPADTKTDTTISNSNITFGPSGTVTDNVTVTGNSGGPAPSGTVDFYFCQTGTDASTLQAGPCAVSTANLEDSKAPLSPSPADPASSIGTSTTATPTSPGTWCFGAVYSGDGNYNGSQDNTTDSNTDPAECVLVAKAPSHTTTTVQGASGAVTNASVGDKATVSGFSGGPTPTGSVVFTLYSSASALSSGSPCDSQQGASSFTITGNPQTVGLSGGSATAAALGPLPAGHYGYEAVYGGDSNYTGSTGNCEPFTVAPASTNTATTLVGTSGAKTNASVSDQATVTTTATGPFAPTGTVTFTLYTDANTLSSGSPCDGQSGVSVASVTGNPDSGVTLTGGSASSGSFGPLPAGNYGFEAVYSSGDGNFTGSTGNCEPFTVAPASTNTATTLVGTDGAVTNASVSDQATVTTTATGPFTPTGTVTFTLFKSSSVLGSGSPCSSQDGASVDTAVSGNPDSGVALSGGSASSSSFGPLPAGNYGFEAVYTSGDGNFTGSTGNCEPFTVAPASTNTATTLEGADGAQTGASISDQAVVSTTATGPFTPAGTVSFTLYTDASTLSTDSPCAGQSGASVDTSVSGNPDSGVTLSGGSASSGSFGPLPAGNYGIEAVYTSSNGNFTGSTGNCEPFTVAPAPTQTATTPNGVDGAQTGASVTDTATVSTSVTSFAPTGTVSFTLYSSDTPLGSASPCTADGQPATTVVDVTGNPDTGVTLTDGSATSGSFGPLPAGNYGFEAVFTSGDNNFTGSTGNCEPFSVGLAPTGTTTTVINNGTGSAWADGTAADAAPASVHDTSAVSGKQGGIVPTGSVTYTLYNGECTGTVVGSDTEQLNADGSVPPSKDFTGLAAGQYGFIAVYSGDNHYATSTGDCEPFTVLVPPTVTASKSESTPGTPPANCTTTATTVLCATVNPFDPTTNLITYNITLTNSGQLDELNATVTDPIPAGVTVGTIGQGGTSDGTKITWTGVNVPVDGTTTLTFTATVDNTDTNGQTIVNQATVTVPSTDIEVPGNGPGSSCDGNTCQTNTVSNPVAFPIVTYAKKSTPATGSTVKRGDTIVYEIDATNTGGADATNVVVTDTVPAGTTFVSAADGGTEANGTVTWTIPTLAAGATTAVHFTVTVNSDDTNGQVIDNVALATDVNTPNCAGAATCDTNHVTQTVLVPTPATAPLVTTTTTKPKPALAFTGADVLRTVEIAFGALAGGALLLLASRRRRRSS